MMQPLRLILFGLALVTLAGCGGQAAPTDTLTPSPTTDTGPTLPPSWTPGTPSTLEAPSQNIASSTPMAEPPTLSGGPTLPPSWTPAAIPSVTQPPLVESGPATATRQVPTITPALVLTSPLVLPTRRSVGGPPTPAPSAVFNAACAVFGQATPTDTSIFAKEKAQISWAAVKGAEAYRVWVLNAANVYSFDKTVTETTITIPGEVFIGPGVYAWEVMPVLHSDRMCGSLTGVIVVMPGKR